MDEASLEQLIRTVTEEVVRALSAREGLPRASNQRNRGSKGKGAYEPDSNGIERFDGKLVAEQHVEELARKGVCRVLLREDAIITPLAGDRAREKEIEFVRRQSSSALTCPPRARGASRRLVLLAANTNRSLRDTVLEAAGTCGFVTEMETPSARTAGAIREAAVRCARQVANGDVERAVIIDENAFSLAGFLARQPKVRVSICWDAESAVNARKECGCDVLVLSNRLLGMTMVRRIVTAWLCE